MTEFSKNSEILNIVHFNTAFPALASGTLSSLSMRLNPTVRQYIFAD